MVCLAVVESTGVCWRMSHLDDPLDDSDAPPSNDRLAALERQIAALRLEVAGLRDVIRTALPASEIAGVSEVHPPFVRNAIAAALRKAPPGAQSLTDRLHANAAISGDELESLVGRYGTLALAAVVILMAVGAVIFPARRMAR